MSKDIDWNMLFRADEETLYEVINSPKKVVEEQQKSTLDEKINERNFNEIMYELNTIKTIKEDLNLFFPEGFSIDNVMVILEFYCRTETNFDKVLENDISQLLELAAVQGVLYANFLCYLGFLNKKEKDNTFLFTEKFSQYKQLPYQDKIMFLFRTMIEHETIKNCFYYCNRYGYDNKYKEIIYILNDDPNIRYWDKERLNVGRNARCIKNWYGWVERNI